MFRGNQRTRTSFATADDSEIAIELIAVFNKQPVGQLAARAELSSSLAAATSDTSVVALALNNAVAKRIS